MSAEIKESVTSFSNKVQELYWAINYQFVWVGKDYLTQYAELLVHEIVAYEFKVAELYQEYMSHLLYGNIDWKVFQAKLKHKRNVDGIVHNVLSTDRGDQLRIIGFCI